LKSGDKVITGNNGYITRIFDEPGPRAKYGSIIGICPNSELILKIRGKRIIEIQLIKGIFKLSTGCPISMPFAEVHYTLGAAHFWVNVEREGSNRCGGWSDRSKTQETWEENSLISNV